MNEAPLILIVEDDPDDVVLVRRAFLRLALPLHLVVLNDGLAAIRYLSGTDEFADRIAHPLPRFVLLDLKLPGLSGHEVLAWLRQRPDIGLLPVVVLTSSAQGPDIERAYSLGANSYLVKPVAFDDLIALIGAVAPYWGWHNEPPSNYRTAW